MTSRFLVFIACLCLLTACDSTGSLKELRSAKPTGDAYQTALAASYRDFSELKVVRYDWWTSKYFADKGLMAAYGRDIEPEEAKNWDIPATLLPEFNDARAKLLEAVKNNRSTQPDVAAAAVVAYDRWVELQHNGWNAPAIEEQRDAFFALLTKLNEVHVESAATTTEDGAGKRVESTSTVLYFPNNSDKLGESAKAAMAQLVEYVRTAGDVAVVINGHADRVGNADYNMSLSERRARFVMQALKAAGLSEKIMKYFAFGETDPAVATADGVAEQKNRRVEIFIE